MSEYEDGYKAGRRDAAQRMLHLAHELTGNHPLTGIITMSVERNEAIAALREVCADNDWPDNLSLADIIRKHVRR